MSSTRLEPPSVRQHQGQQQASQQHQQQRGGPSLMRNATIKEFLSDFPREEWPAVLEVRLFVVQEGIVVID
jgi:hypothetical protein